MKRITIISIAILVALYLAVYRPWRTGYRQGEKDSAGVVNALQDTNSPATGALDVKQSVKDVQHPVKAVKRQVTATLGAKRHGKGVKRSMAGMRRNVEQQGADLKLQVIETQDVEQVTIDVMRPTENVKVIFTRSQGEFEKPSGKPIYVEDMKGSSDRPQAQRINIAVPERKECSTPYVWVELSDP